MGRVAHGNSTNFGKALCDVLGIGTDKVASLSIFVSPRELVSVTVEMYLPELTSDEIKMIAEALRKDDKRVDISLDSPTYRIINVGELMGGE